MRGSRGGAFSDDGGSSADGQSIDLHRPQHDHTINGILASKKKCTLEMVFGVSLLVVYSFIGHKLNWVVIGFIRDKKKAFVSPIDTFRILFLE